MEGRERINPFKPVDTVDYNSLEQESVITSGMPLVTLESPLL